MADTKHEKAVSILIHRLIRALELANTNQKEIDRISNIQDKIDRSHEETAFQQAQKNKELSTIYA
ncbi:MAG: hypothetical protein EPO11_02325, partial [Gammaproteobacteria bacterium]